MIKEARIYRVPGGRTGAGGEQDKTLLQEFAVEWGLGDDKKT